MERYWRSQLAVDYWYSEKQLAALAIATLPHNLGDACFEDVVRDDADGVTGGDLNTFQLDILTEGVERRIRRIHAALRGE